MHKTSENRVNPVLTPPSRPIAESGSGKPDGSGRTVRTIDQLSHDIVSTWTTDTAIRMRPSQKAALKSLIVQEFRKYIAADIKQATNPSAASSFERGRLKCIEAIAGINEEPFLGFICKQRALNACIQMPEE